MRWLLLTTATCSVFVVPAVSAQTDGGVGTGTPRAARRFALSYSLGNATGGPHHTIEAGMRAAGLADTLHSCFLFGCENDQVYPRRVGSGRDSTFAASYRLRPGDRGRTGWGLRLERAHTSLGGVSGFGEPYRLIDLDFSATFTSALVFAEVGGVRMGAGPSAAVLTVEHPQAMSVTTHKARKLGLVLEAGAAVPARSRFYLDLGAQYRLIPRAEMGPYVQQDFAGTGSQQTMQTTLPRLPLSYSHLRVAVGFGVRL